jgi:hypothetical protein
VPPPSSGWKKKSKNPARSMYEGLLLAYFMLDSFFDAEDGGGMFSQKADQLSMVYMVLYPKRYNSSIIRY